MLKEIKIWLKTVGICICLLLIMSSILFAAAYSINRGWNAGQYHSDKMAADRVYELLTLGSD